MSEAPILVVSRLKKSYLSGGEPLRVLQGVELQVAASEMVAITGESGSGKSTLLHLLGGMERPDDGRILFQSVDISALEADEVARFRNRKVGFIFQFHHLLPEFSALENVMFPLLIGGSDLAEASQKASQLLSRVGLRRRLSHRPGELSGGEQQRVAVARALVNDPELILADEPTGNLDQKTSEKIHELFLELHRSLGLTLVLATHNRALAALCDRSFEMRAGQLHLVG